MKAALSLLLVILVLAGLPGTGAAQAKLTIPDSIYDFGYVPQNSEISHVFWLHSTGSEPLKIISVKPGCGCTKAPLEKELLPVGDSTRLEVIFSTRRYNGRQSKRPSITTNEGDLAKRVQFTANVVAVPDSTFPIRIKPYKFDISQFGETNATNRDFVIENVSDSDLDLSVVDMPQNMFEIKLPKHVKAGQTAKGSLKLKDACLDKEFSKSVTIGLSDAANTRFTIPVKRTLRAPGTMSDNSPSAQNTAVSNH